MASRAARNVSPATEPVRLKKGGNAGGNWIKDAVKPANKGKFSAKAKAAGMSTSAYAKEKSSAPGKLGKEARFAETMGKLRPKKFAGGGPGGSGGISKAALDNSKKKSAALDDLQYLRDIGSPYENDSSNPASLDTIENDAQADMTDQRQRDLTGGYRKGGLVKRANGGSVKHDDAGADKRLFMKMFKTEEAKEDKPVKKARGGKMSKPRAPRAPKMPMPPQAPMAMPAPPPVATQGAPDPNQPFKKGGKIMRKAVGGAAKLRLGQSTPSGQQKPASVPKSNLI